MPERVLKIRLRQGDPSHWKKAIKAAGGAWNSHLRVWEVAEKKLNRETFQELKDRIKQ